MNITIIDGQGGQLGSQLVKEILTQFQNINITAIGTNSVATAAMIKAGAKNAATGENPVIVACRDADVIVGPIGIVIADALYGEVTPKMAAAVGQSRALRVLIPVNKCDSVVAGVCDTPLGTLINEAVERIIAVL